MALTLAILSALASTGASALTLVFLAACAPNGTPQQLAHLKSLAILVAAVWFSGLVVAAWASLARRYGLAAGVGIAPAAFCIGLFAWLFATSG